MQAIQTHLADGIVADEFRDYFADLLQRHAVDGCEAVVLGCTELPLAITQDISTLEIIDPLALQCRACVDFALLP